MILGPAKHEKEARIGRISNVFRIVRLLPGGRRHNMFNFRDNKSKRVVVWIVVVLLVAAMVIPLLGGIFGMF